MSNRVTTIDRLTESQRQQYRTLDGLIRRNLTSAGAALQVMEAERLYREDFPTFDAYCHDVQDCSRSYGYRKIAAAEVNAGLSPIGGALNESSARELVPLTPKQRLKVAKAAKMQAEQAFKDAKKKAKSEGKPAPKPRAPTAETYRALAGAELLRSMTPEEQKEKVEADALDRAARVRKLDQGAALTKLAKYGRKAKQCAAFCLIWEWYEDAAAAVALLKAIRARLGPALSAREKLGAD